MKNLEGRVAVITGAGSGIGEALARRFAAQGMKIVVTDIEEKQAQRVARSLTQEGAETLAARVDVSKPEQLVALADRVESALGGCDLLCNNAGVVLMGSIATRSCKDFQWLIDVNLKGVIHGVLAFVPRMIAGGRGGHVVNTASINGLVAYPLVGAYITTKYGVVGFSETLRLELAPHGIGVTAVCPGGVDTNLLDAARNRPEEYGSSEITPEEIAAVSASAGSDPSTVPPADVVARAVLEGVLDDDPYVITHPENRDQLIARHAALMAAFDKAEKRAG